MYSRGGVVYPCHKIVLYELRVVISGDVIS